MSITVCSLRRAGRVRLDTFFEQSPLKCGAFEEGKVMSRNSKSNGRARDHFVVNGAGRQLAEMHLPQETLREIDDAKRQIAEVAGVDADRHIRIEIEMLFLVTV